MKPFLFFVLSTAFLLGCENKPYINPIATEEQDAQPDIYVPGTSSLMNEIQRYHHKLWLAGQEEFWDLASFQVHEMEENF